MIVNRPDFVFGILYVCTGNICRSPTADAIMRALVAGVGGEGRVRVDSAGTHGYHIGNPPDPRSIETALRRGVDMRALRARKVEPADFAAFDWIVAMDGGHHAVLAQMAAQHAGGPDDGPQSGPASAGALGAGANLFPGLTSGPVSTLPAGGAGGEKGGAVASTAPLRAELHRFTAFAGQPGGNVPDPYYGGRRGFDEVYDLIEGGCQAMLAELRRRKVL